MKLIPVCSESKDPKERIMENTDSSCHGGMTFICLAPVDENIREAPSEQFAEVLKLAETLEPPLLVIDLSQIQYINSSFVAFLLRLSNQISVKRSGRFGVCHLTPFCQQVLQSCRLHELFDLFATRDDAIAAYSQE
jgi:anti-anti-sigma factor